MQLIIGPRFFDKENASNSKTITLISSNDQLVARADFSTSIAIETFQPFSQYLTGITKVIIGHTPLSNLDFFRHLPNVESVDVMTSLLADISGLRNLPKLRELFLQRPTYSMGVLGEISTLESIFIGKWMERAKGIFNLKQLSKVGIHFYGRSDMQDLSHWQSLKEIWFNGGKLITLDGISQSVIELRLTQIRNLQSLQALSESPHLEDLRVTGCRKIHSLEGIEGCRKLRILAVDKCGILESLWPLQKLEGLEFVLFGSDVQQNVDDGSIEVLYSLPNLKRLIISRKTELNVDRVLETSPECQIILTR